MKSHHVKVEATGRNRVTANLAGQSPGRLGDRLFQQRARFQATLGPMIFLQTVPAPLWTPVFFRPVQWFRSPI
jgi:hypothetical protein